MYQEKEYVNKKIIKWMKSYGFGFNSIELKDYHCCEWTSYSSVSIEISQAIRRTDKFYSKQRLVQSKWKNRHNIRNISGEKLSVDQ